MQERFYAVATALLQGKAPWLDRLLTDGFLDRVVRQYSRSLAYHNLAHIVWMLEECQKRIADPSIELVLAILFHDWEYSVRSSHNEALSASLAWIIVHGAGAPDETAWMCRDLILATKDHRSYDQTSAKLIGLDLGILGQPEDVYLEYKLNVRQEYPHLSDQDWAEGRKAVLKRFLARPQIYDDFVFRGLWEQQARINLQAELDSLT